MTPTANVWHTIALNHTSIKLESPLRAEKGSLMAGGAFYEFREEMRGTRLSANT